MKDFTKVVCPGKVSVIGYKRLQPVYCEIVYNNGRLSITGVVGPFKGGSCAGSCGQIVDTLECIEDFDWSIDWNRGIIDKFTNIWKLWHLNDLKAGCEHQRVNKWEDRRINPKELPNSRANKDDRGILAVWVTQDEHKDGLLSKPCQVCGYKYGSAWLKVEVPEDVLLWLYKLPNSVNKPCWV